MKHPLVGITCSTSALDPASTNAQDRLNLAYSRALSMAGIVPVILPNLAGPDLREAWLGRLDGLLLSGGADVDPRVYDEQPFNDTVKVDGPRDEAELPLIREAVARDVPILAICRGIQMLNVALGGTLVQDIPAQIRTTILHSQKKPRDSATHEIEIAGGSRLAGILGGRRVQVNSFHHQAVKDVADGLDVTARAPDGVIEAIESPGARFVVAVQYHPEELVDASAHALQLFRGFAAAMEGG